MSINTDGPKLRGKLLKSGSKLLKSVRMTQYSFSQIGQSQNIEFDNLDRNIIHAKFHSDLEMTQNVKESQRLKEVLYDPSRPPMAIIMPGDFTQDWLNERLSNKRRMLGFDDEDDFDDPFARQGNSPPDGSKSEILKGLKEAEKSKTISARPASLTSVIAQENIPPIEAEELIKKARPVSIVKDPYAQHNAIETEIVSLGGKPSTMKSKAKNSDDFIPLDDSENGNSGTAEDQAIATYKQRAEMESANIEHLEQLKAEAQSQGYNDGFRNGEEKGVVSGQRNAGEVFSRVSDLLKEFEGLKRNVLENIQKNFFELSQAVAEALLEREFSVKPESFAKVLEKVLKDTVTDDQFKIRLHPDTWQRVTDLRVPHLEGHLIKDLAIAIGDFKVESNLTVVDGNVKKIVAQMLQNVDMDLFEETKATG
ncbi:MAG: FliH/SctL family protein [Proteobacteria bacterium]|nr:FliH/SctL family protein [Pseudomonadota bacterium]